MFGELLKGGFVLAEDSRRNKVYLFIFGHFNLRLRVQIDHQELGPVVLKDNDASVFSDMRATLEKFWFASVAVTMEFVLIIMIITSADIIYKQ